MTRKPEDPALAVAPRPSTEFVGLVAALAFIAAGPSAAAVTERSADQFRQDTFSLEASLASSPAKSDAGNGGSFRLAQSTQGEDNGECLDFTGQGCDEGNQSDAYNQFGAFHYETLPHEQNFYGNGWQDVVDTDNAMNHMGAPYAQGVVLRFYGAGGPGAKCLLSGGAITFIVKTRSLGCWRAAKAAPVRGLKVPALGPAAQRVLTKCSLRTGSVTLRNGAFACIATPLPVVRIATRGARGRASLGWPWRG
ncbi:MAG: hypothetical protein Q8L59_06610 [Phenylobacterium sp.]|uniref:hypothetical protein n=1 Tax=Phenylobacterium sp. TaxID=1871053 RepID=UPI002735B6BD|nr:hypothetical protein [Phenylobacterium sp.]MDP1641840.1 hypothetical protein [Phenylobacterium sp.]MDP3116038.1 hypothetical protein [Phenylobacterium sp.]